MNYLQKKYLYCKYKNWGGDTIDIMSVTPPTPASNLSIFLGKRVSSSIVKIIASILETSKNINFIILFFAFLYKTIIFLNSLRRNY